MKLFIIIVGIVTVAAGIIGAIFAIMHEIKAEKAAEQSAKKDQEGK